MSGKKTGTKDKGAEHASFASRSSPLAPRPSPLAPTLWSVLGLTLATVACLAPFVNKAFHIDDTLFLYAARHVQTNPIDFYGFRVNWYGESVPMGGEINEEGRHVAGVMQNPPLACYYIALTSGLLGWSEPALHLAFLLPAVAAVWGTYFLSRRFCNHPVLAALATLLTPAFLVSSTNLMCDTLTLAFWVWAIVCWDGGLRHRQMALLALAAMLICLAALSKYIGVALIPLLLVYTAAFQWKAGGGPVNFVTPCLFLAIPAGVLSAYQEFTEGVYGRGLLFQAVGYAASVRHRGGNLLLELLGALCFMGGGMASVLFFTPLLWSRRQLLLVIGLAALIFLGVSQAFLLKGNTSNFAFGQQAEAQPQGADAPRQNPVPWLGITQYALFTAAGFSLLFLTGLDLWKRRDAASLLLMLWVGGIFFFATICNWTLNMRSLLPLVPAAGILIARRLDDRFPSGKVHSPAGLAWPLVPAGILALLVTYADYQMAGSERQAAANIVALSAQHPGTLWFQGHWGFQYYMDPDMKATRARPFDFQDFKGKPGDLIVYPANNTNVDPRLPPVPRIQWKQLDMPTCPWLASFDPSVGASFYASIWGPLPFAFGRVRPTRYVILEVMPAGAAKVPS
jgi:Dolichyl-phosphate-mannose-protein mannosyltransferase